MHHLRAAGHLQLAVDAPHKGAHRVARHAQLARHLVQRVAARHQAQHLQLARGQRLRGGLRLRRPLQPGHRTGALLAQQQLARHHGIDGAAARVQAAHLFQHRLGSQVLEQIAHGAGLDGGQHMLLVAKDGADHHRRPGVAGTHGGNHLQAAAIGQAQVHQHHVHGAGPIGPAKLVQGLRAAGRRPAQVHVLRGIDHAHQGVAAGGVVLHHGHADDCGATRRGGRGRVCVRVHGGGVRGEGRMFTWNKAAVMSPG